ncbi:MAG: hypothetical protein AAGK23_03355 [Pseudomonadota bacterium]
MSNNVFLETVCVPELGEGTALMIWGFRMCALGRSECGCLERCFDQKFEPDVSDYVVEELKHVVRQFGNHGKRGIYLGQPNCIHITHDEASILSALAAAQVGDQSLRDAHVTWLQVMPPSLELQESLDRLAQAFLSSDYVIEHPLEHVTDHKQKFERTLLMGVGGHA